MGDPGARCGIGKLRLVAYHLRVTGLILAQTSPTTAPATTTTWWLIPLVIIIAILLAIGFWIWLKGRELALPNSQVFQASRWSRGNRIFPAQVVISPASLTLYHPQWIGKLEESIHMAHVASIKIDTHLMFSDVFIETSGGHDPIVCHGHVKGDAVEMKRLIERFQSEYYKAGTAAVPAPAPAPPAPPNAR